MYIKIFLPPHVFWDLGSGIRDGKKSGSGIRDKHPGSATLGLGLIHSLYWFQIFQSLLQHFIFITISARLMRKKPVNNVILSCLHHVKSTGLLLINMCKKYFGAFSPHHLVNFQVQPS
jgi:hypothetical protein